MQPEVELKGVYCALITPLQNGRVHVHTLQRHVETMIDEGLDGLLLLGTTGEGTSLGEEARELTIKATLEVSGSLKIVVGTGTSALADTIHASRRAFDLGAEAVVVVPPYYFKNVSDDGLFEYFKQVLDQAVPDGKQLLMYLIPKLTGIPVSTSLLQKLYGYGQGKFSGVKDSTSDMDHGRKVITEVPGLRVFVGTEALLLDGMRAGAEGCITAGANVSGGLAVQVYNAEQNGDHAKAEALQARLSAARAILDRFPPNPPMLKHLLAHRYGGEGWEVCPPLVSMSDAQSRQLIEALTQLNDEALNWLKIRE